MKNPVSSLCTNFRKILLVKFQVLREAAAKTALRFSPERENCTMDAHSL
jgi:hypothetical protein